MPKSYSEKMSRRVVVLAAVPLALAFAAKLAVQEMGDYDSRWLAFGFVLASYAALFFLGSRYWKALDDIQRQGQAVSWYWGSLAGVGATACLIVATGLERSQFTVGAATMIVFQLGCSLILHALWWLRGRGFSFRPKA